MRSQPATPVGDRELAGRVVAVAGGASGFGREIVRVLLRRGASVVAGDRVGARVERLVEASGPPAGRNLVPVVGDLACPAHARELLDAGPDRFGRIDAVIVSTGTAAAGSLRDAEDDDWRATLDDNLGAYVAVTREVLRRAARSDAHTPSSLVFIASKLALAPSSGFGHYPVAKAAQLQLARVAAIEGGPFGLRVNAVSPGAVIEGSNFWTDELLASKAADHGVAPEELSDYYAARTLLGLHVTTEDVAEAAVFLASPRSRAITGCVLNVDGGLPASFPR